MFEIRVICANTDIGPVTKGLVEAFKLSNVHRRYTIDGKRLRLYANAEPRTTPAAWPAPEQAYGSTTPQPTGSTSWTVNGSCVTPRSATASPCEKRTAQRPTTKRK